MGTMTLSDRFFIMEKMPLFQFWGVFPTSVAIVSTLAFTSVNMVSRFDVIQPVSRSFMNSVIFSVIPPIYLSKQSCKLWNQVYSNQYDATARHQLFYPQLGVKLCSMAGGGVQKIYMVFLREPSRRDRSGSDLFHLRDGFEIKMNFDRNVSCFIFVNALMHDDFFD